MPKDGALVRFEDAEYGEQYGLASGYMFIIHVVFLLFVESGLTRTGGESCTRYPGDILLNISISKRRECVFKVFVVPHVMLPTTDIVCLLFLIRWCPSAVSSGEERRAAP